MGSKTSFVDFAAEQIAGAGTIRTKAMFGEFGFYCDDIFCGAICDNTLFVKATDAGRELAPDIALAPAYKGAKPSLKIPEERLEDAEWLSQLVAATRDALA
ncbi:MAG: TfoX/Sxy family protein [Pseudomonadota bacterium]